MQEEPVRAQGGDNAAGGHRLASERRGCAGALNGANRNERDVIVDNRSLALRIARRGAHHVRDIDEEGFVGLHRRVAIHDDGEDIAGLGGGDRLRGERLRDVVGAGERRIIGRRDIEGNAADGRGRGQRDRKGVVGGAGVAFVQRNIIDRECGCPAPARALRGKREIVDGEPVIGTGGIEVIPANEECGARSDVEAGDGDGRDHRAIGGGVAVQCGSGGGRADGAVEVQRIDVGPGARGKCRGVSGVLEVETIGAGCGGVADSPLFAGVGDDERGDGTPGVVDERSANGRREGTAQQSAERAISGVGAKAINVAGVTGAGAAGIGTVVQCAGTRFEKRPTGGKHGIGGARTGEAIEILGVRGARRG